MTVSWKSWPSLLCICLSLCATGVVSQEFQLEPLNSTVLQGSDVQFKATVQGAWEIMTWSVGEFLELTIIKTTNGNITRDQFSASFCSSDKNCVEFTIHSVTRNQSGLITCSVMGDFGSKTAQLNVQANGTVTIMGGNVTAVQDEQVEFQCVTSAWFPIPTISWIVNGEAVNSSLYNTTSMMDGDFYNSASVLNFQAVSNTKVECRATVSTLTNPHSSSVFLVVAPKPTDWTVLIAVVVSIGGVALLVLLILGIIFCYRWRKKKQQNYQDEMSKRVRTQSQISVANAAGRKHGHVNSGYLGDGQTSVAPSELTDSGFSQAKGSSAFEITDGVTSNQAGKFYSISHLTVSQSVVIAHRHATIV